MKSGKAAWLVLAAAVLFFVWSAQAFAQEKEEVIAEGIYAGGVSLGGMTREEARKAVDEYVSGLGRQTLTVKTDVHEDRITLGELGLDWTRKTLIEEAFSYGRDGNLLSRYKAREGLKFERREYDPGLSFNEEKIRQFAAEKLPVHDMEPVEPSLTRENETFVVNDGANGVRVNLEQTVHRIREALADWKQGDLEVEAVAEITPPQQDAELLRQVQDPLGSYSTNYATGNVGRSKSLELSAQRLNGTIIYPGETVSVSALMGPRTIEGGYGVAGAFIGNNVTDSVGAGICQTASTLYAAALYAELTVTERHNHSMTVNYMPAALDATIYAGDSYTEPQKDLKLKNEYACPVYIAASAGGGTVSFTIYGKEERPADRRVEYVSNVLSEVWPTEVTWTEDANLPEGYQIKTQGAYAGVTASLTKVVTENGAVTERTLLHTDRYMMVNEKRTMGTNPGLGFDAAGNIVPVELPPAPQEPEQTDSGQTNPEQISPEQTNPEPVDAGQTGREEPLAPQ